MGAGRRRVQAHRHRRSGAVDVARAVARARQAVAVLASPTLRGAQVGGGELDDRTRAAVDAFDWVDEHGPDRALLGSTARTLQLLQAPAALEFDRIARMPHAEAERVPLSLRIVGVVGDRLGRARPMTASRANAAIAMFAEDVASCGGMRSTRECSSGRGRAS